MPFDAVAETLLKGGVAPRHVRRYVRELDEHLTDLTAQQRDAGYEGEDAAIRARARLGDDAELAQAMLDQPGMRSWPAQLPWLVFLLLPPVATLLLGTLLYAAVYFIGDSAAKINAVVPLPQNWLIGFSTAAMTAIDVLAVPMAATLLALLADRQRLKPLWPLLGIALLLLATPMFSSKFGHHPRLGVHYGLVIPIRWSTVLRFWPLMLSHALALLPAAWLILRRRSAT
ncbi:MAG TPA: hypothetical protein VJP60_04535 [Rhizomicrobium sp.]|nr:hypothetical protein [Rhizomicrobium sp.]